MKHIKAIFGSLFLCLETNKILEKKAILLIFESLFRNNKSSYETTNNNAISAYINEAELSSKVLETKPEKTTPISIDRFINIVKEFDVDYYVLLPLVAQ